MHQVRTSANFATHSRFITWFTAGLNHQLEHHLFPNVAHTHYSGLRPIVRAVAQRHGLECHELGSLPSAVGQHFALLKSFGARLAACVRATDTVARIGGDEFAVILESVEIERDAHAVAQKIVAALREPFEIEGHRVEVSASVGVAILCDRDGFLAEALLKRADRALYDAKGAGKDRYALAA